MHTHRHKAPTFCTYTFRVMYAIAIGQIRPSLNISPRIPCKWCIIIFMHHPPPPYKYVPYVLCKHLVLSYWYGFITYAPLFLSATMNEHTLSSTSSLSCYLTLLRLLWLSWCTCLSTMQSIHNEPLQKTPNPQQSVDYETSIIIIRLCFFITAIVIITLLFVFTLALGFDIALAFWVS